jgi:hypothetical protein
MVNKNEEVKPYRVKGKSAEEVRAYFRERAKAYYHKHRDKILQYSAKYYQQNKEAISDYKKDWYQTNKASVRKQQTDYLNSTDEEQGLTKRQIRQKKLREKYQSDPEYRAKVLAVQAEHREKNRAKTRAYMKDYMKNYRKKDK